MGGGTNPAPMAGQQTARSGNFTYTIPGFGAASSHDVRLHFAETFFSTAGSRVFNVSINGTTSASTGHRVFNVSINGTRVLSNFDIVKAS